MASAPVDMPQIVSRLASVGVGMDTLSGVLITHEHGDHCRGLPVLLTHGGVDPVVRVSHSRKMRDRLQRAGKPFEYIEFEFADHDSNAMVFDHRGDDAATALGDALARLMTDDAKADAMSAKGRETAERFRLETIAKHYLHDFKDVLSGQRS